MPGGAERDRTADLVIANDALSQLSYGPVPGFGHHSQGGAAFSEPDGRCKGKYPSAAPFSLLRESALLWVECRYWPLRLTVAPQFP